MPQPAATVLDANVRYHDLAARHYDAKWGITYGEEGQAQVTAKLLKALGRAPGVFDRALEIGAGTGYFTLNLMLAGMVREAVATDISPRMLEALAGSADRLGLVVDTTVCEASDLPFEDGSFDLVFGHAVLHHVPDLQRAFGEFRRVLHPGGVIAFCGEPSRRGDRISSLPKRGAYAAAPVWRALIGASERGAGRNGGGPSEEARLEQVVDLHSFTPAELGGHARAAGLESVRVSGEELAAALFGWINRTLEATVDPSDVPQAWRVYAHRGYLLLQRLDRALLEPRLSPALFYNLLVSARSPG
jgi:ubiquinone/menaquinone biosynthesis C-methylase UbiE